MDNYTISINAIQQEGETKKIISAQGTISDTPVKSLKLYSDLTASQKATYDAFINMVKTFK